MARSLGTLTVSLLMQTGQFETDAGRAARLAERNAKDMERAYGDMGRRIGAAVAAGAGIAAAGLALYMRNTIEAEKVQAQLAARITDTMAAAGRSIGELNKQAESLQKITVFDDESIGQAQAMLLTFKQIRGVNFDKTVESALDLATVMGTQATDAAKLLGKALNDPAKGLTQLTRAGISFTATERERIKALAEAGRITEAQSSILEKFEGSMGSAAEAARDTLGGSLQALKNTFDNLMEGDAGDAGVVGTRMAVESLIDTLNDPAVQQGFGAIIEGAAKAATAFADALPYIVSFNEKLSTALGMSSGKTRKANAWDFVTGVSEGMKALGEGRWRDAQASSDRAYKGFWGGTFGTGDQVANFGNVVGTTRPDFSNVRGTPLGRSPEEDAVGGGRRSTQANRERERELQRLAEAVERYKDRMADLRAEMEGPLAKAQREYEELLATAREDLKDAAGETETYVKFKEQETLKYEQHVAAIRQSQDVVGQVREDYKMQLQLGAMSAQQQRIEEEVQRRLNAARQAGRKDLETYEAELRSAITTSVQLVDQQQAQIDLAEQFSDNWLYAIDSVAMAWGDWLASGFRDTDSFLDSLKNTFKGWLSEIASMFAKQQLGRWASSMFGGAGSAGGGGGFWSQLGNMAMQYFGGGSGGFGSGTGNGLISSAISGYANGGFSGAWQGVLGSVGLGGLSGGAAAAGAWGAGLGSTAFGAAGTSGAFGAFGATSPYWVGGTAAGLAGTGGAGAAAGAGSASAGAGGAAAAVGAVAWVVAILAAMYQNAQYYKQGWREKGGDIGSYEYKTPGNAVVLGTDRMLRALGMSDKWASIMSGSSIVARGFGRLPPRITDYGFTGSVSFGGFDGSNLAYVKEKGGWFRSDKKYTKEFEITAGIDRAFDSVAISIRGRAQGIAEQLGMDITAALGSFRLDLGKIKLDKDPEKAKQQIADKIAEVSDRMINAAVDSLGFAHLLDDGFAATEIMGALSASIELVTGSAKTLGRALTDFEKSNITKAVEYFEGLALKNGTELAGELERVLGVLGNYSSIIADVDSQLRMSGLNDYQQAQLQIELQYRGQVKQLNEMAKALGLSGARAEDLAKVEQLRALNMAELQKQMEAQRNSFLSELGLSDLSPLRDDQKLSESMQLLRDAVGAGDMGLAQQYAQQALGFGRNLYASGADYDRLWREVNTQLGGMNFEATAGLSEDLLQQMADDMASLPEDIARALFNLAAGISLTPPPPAPEPVPPPPPEGGWGGGGGGGGWGGGGGGADPQVIQLLGQIAAAAQQGNQQAVQQALERFNTVVP